MPKKTIKLIIIIVTLVILGIAGIFLYFATQGAPSPQDEPVPREFTPFGRAPDEEARRVIELEPEEDIMEIPEEEVERVTGKLQKISTFAIAGATVFLKERELESSGQEQEAVELFDFSGYKTLRLGSDGREVEELQIVLNRQDPSPDLEITENFDETTKQAVILFQAENNLVADGIAGKKTFAALNKFQGITASSTERVAAVRYVKKSSGHIYETFLDQLAEKKLSVTTIPRLHEAFFGNENEGVIFRYINNDGKTIETFSGILSSEQEGGGLAEVIGQFIPQNVFDVSISPEKDEFFYLMESNGGVVGTTASFSGNNKEQIFSSPFTEWLSQWVNSRTIAFNTKPSAVAPGFLYTLNTKTGAFNRVLGNIDGLTTLMSPDGKSVLLSKSIDKTIETLLYDISERNTIDLGINTLSEKCVWSKESVDVYCAVPQSIQPDFYPDVWYQGLVSFSDNIWKINTKTNISDLIARPGEEIDAVNLSLDENEDYLVFINKKDNTLWSLDLR